jgi:1-deoxy-D-xylulose-5-phosphate reductoisomerase
MGKKITIDSATLMNKGLELIEAMHLFDVTPDRIEVVIHPESIIHSMVEFADGSTIAQLSNPDMRQPIQYALTYPNRLPSLVKPLDLTQVKSLTFEEPDIEAFPCLRLAYEAAKKGDKACAALNRANEDAVGKFLNNEINFHGISDMIQKALDKI